MQSKMPAGKPGQASSGEGAAIETRKQDSTKLLLQLLLKKKNTLQKSKLF